MKKTNKIVIGWLVGIVLVSLLTGCGSDKKKAMETIEKYMNAWAANDMTTMYECYDPDLQAASEGLTNSIAGYFGIEDGYSTGLALGGLFQNAFQDAAGLSVDYELVKVQESEFEKNDGHVDAKYKATVEFEKYDASVDLEILYKFDMVKRDDNWYIKNVVEEQIESDEEIQEKAKAFVEKVSKKKNELVKKEGLVEPTNNAKGFSEGKAWVSGEAIGKQWICINTEGKIVFSLEEEYNPYSNFNNGSALVYKTVYENGSNNKKFSLINEKGKIVADLSEYEVICPENYAGRVMVMNTGETFEGRWTELGVMGANGKWEIPLTKEHAFIEEDGKLWGGHGSDFIYMGNQIIARDNGILETEYKCFNMETGNTFSCAADYHNDSIEVFSDDFLIRFSTDRNSVLMTDTLGNTKEIIPDNFENESRSEIGRYSEGLFFVRGAYKFYDENGAMKIDLSQYEVHGTPYFQDGYALIEFSNEYFTIIDKQGKFMFDPIKAEAVGGISDGIVSYSDEEHNWHYLSVKGKELFKGNYGGLVFSDGYALIRIEEGYTFINKKGERLY